jgi:arsenite methyltransferase
VVGDGLYLPLRDGSFDAAVTRSVLIFVADKSAAVRELHRVLRPGGRVSVFEPINSVYERYDRWAGMDLSAVQPAHDRIRAYLKEHSRYEVAMMGFDERDLVEAFVQAGFRSVRLSYEFRYARDRRGARERIALLRARPNPGTPSYEEGARALLGNAAAEHPRRLAKAILTQPAVKINAVAFLAAQRHG